MAIEPDIFVDLVVVVGVDLDFAHWIRNDIAEPVRGVKRLRTPPVRQEDVV